MYPFEYQLPENLPSVFDIVKYPGGCRRLLTVNILYKLKACLDVNGFLSKHLKGEIAPVVHARLPAHMMVSEYRTQKAVRLLCCICRGRCRLAVAMDKNAYHVGEVAQIQCTIDNNSDVDITRGTCRLHQEIVMRAGGHVVKLHKVLAERAFAGVKQRTSVQQPQPMPLVADAGRGTVTSSTTGRIIECRYRIEIACDIPWCPKVRLRLPVTMLPPNNPEAPVWLPTNTADFVAQPLIKHS